MLTNPENNHCIFFGDSYTSGLYPKNNTILYFEPGAINICTGFTLFKLSLESYCKNEINRNISRDNIEYIPRYLCKTDIAHKFENENIRKRLRLWDVFVDTYKDRNINIMLLIGHVDLYSLYYKGNNEYKKNFYTEFIKNYTRLISYIRCILPRSCIYIISMCPFLLKTGNINIPGENRDSDFIGMRNRTLVINKKLKNIPGAHFVNIYEEIWDKKMKDYKFEIYNLPNKNAYNSHVNYLSFQNMLREKLPFTKKIYKENIIRVKNGDYYAECKPSLCGNITSQDYKHKIYIGLPALDSKKTQRKGGGEINICNIYLNLILIIILLIILYFIDNIARPHKYKDIVLNKNI